MKLEVTFYDPAGNEAGSFIGPPEAAAAEAAKFILTQSHDSDEESVGAVLGRVEYRLVGEA